MNSFDRLECGAAHWDPPVVDQPASLTVSIDPPQPQVGDLVTFTFHWSDPDADTPYFDFCGEPLPCTPGAAPAGPGCTLHPTGPWTPPPPRGADGYIIQTASYPRPGTYAWSATLATGSSTYHAWAELNPGAACVLGNPYGSVTILEEPITIGGSGSSTAPSTSTTSTTTRAERLSRG